MVEWLEGDRTMIEVSPDAVGEMVLAAVRENRLYVHTDRMMYAAIQARTKALLDAMPAEA